MRVCLEEVVFPHGNFLQLEATAHLSPVPYHKNTPPPPSDRLEPGKGRHELPQSLLQKWHFGSSQGTRRQRPVPSRIHQAPGLGRQAGRVVVLKERK